MNMGSATGMAAAHTVRGCRLPAVLDMAAPIIWSCYHRRLLIQLCRDHVGGIVSVHAADMYQRSTEHRRGNWEDSGRLMPLRRQALPGSGARKHTKSHAMESSRCLWSPLRGFQTCHMQVAAIAGRLASRPLQRIAALPDMERLRVAWPWPGL